ncbi:CHAD domain-containing protein [Amycolatopsis sp. FDAARGOS 1241]|uniref:CHAD domain-containing protein n=1 Tax=Amycolatopsis sp. FDAARGOS 1241 TaxID=2778070 RepID=UPI00194E8894|nr:CHAD domain-containing protein [Amycolatopsis sp. FDAARGOS 1241]QRP49413.1 CHAD domain-containing protein [Amycolatopsis sp. FDAARGOS 1241]
MTALSPVSQLRPLVHYDITYYDTAGLRLRRHGLALSRTGADWRLDRGDGHGCGVAASATDHVPVELRRLVRAYSRDLELAVVPGPGTRRPDAEVRAHDTAREVVLGYLDAQAEALARADLATRLDEPQGVPGLRGAARRVRATLRTFAPVLGGRRLVRGLSGSVRWFEEGIASGGTPEILDTHRYLQLLNALELLDVVLREQPRPELPKAARRPAGAVLPGLVWTVAAETGARWDAATGESGSAAAVRKSVRRLRYALEAAEAVLPFAPDHLLAQCRDLQELLGAGGDPAAGEQCAATWDAVRSGVEALCR